MKRRYTFVGDRKRQLVSIFDAIGDLALKPFVKKGEDISGRDFANILVLSLDLLGDCVFATPLPRVLKERYPEARVTVLVNEKFVDVFANNPDVDATIAFDTPWFPRHHRKTQISELRQLGAELAGLQFDLAIDPRGDLRHNYLMALTGAPVRLGYGAAGGGFWLTHEADYPFSGHRVERNMKVLEPLGITAEHPTLNIYPALRQRDLISAEFGDPGTPLVVLHPFASCQAKRWPAGRFAEVAADLIGGRGCRVVLIGAASERAEADRIAEDAVKRLLGETGEEGATDLEKKDIAGKLRLFCGKPLSGLIDLLAAADLFIGNDSGPLHLAVAAGTPSIALYSGENDVAIYGPWGEGFELLRSEVECSPCGKLTCSDHRCMEGITVSEVLAAAGRRLG